MVELICMLNYQVVRSATSGAGSSLCGVAPGSFGSKELHYVLRVLSPAACRNPQVFLEVAKSVLRISILTPPKRGTVSADMLLLMLVLAVGP
jgi:E3 ubiquitin-protein ligase HUWE1